VPNSEQYIISKYDEAGTLAWTRISGGAGSDSLTGVVGMGGRVFAVGYTRSQGAGGADAVILEIDPVTGFTVNITLFGGAQDDFANGVATDGTALYVVGETRSFATPAGNVVGQNDLMILRVGCNPVTVDPASIAAGTAGTPYSQAFTQSGGAGTITWSLTGALPNGVTFNTATGVLSGTPTQTGNFPITVTATDANGCLGSRGYTLVVNCQSITVNPVTVPNAIAGTAYSQAFTQSGGIGATTWALAGTLPAGLVFSAASGVLSGTPTEIGSFAFTVTALDANSCGGTRGYTLVVDRAGPFVPTALAADAGSNGVFEAAENAIIAPSWRNDTGAPGAVTGTVTGFTGPGTSTYTIVDGSAAYGTVGAGATASCSAAGGNCYDLIVTVPNPRPAVHWDATFLETLSNADAKTWRLHVGDSFSDVPRSSPFYRFVEMLLHKSVTGGCTATTYCPGGATTRDQMAVFVLVAREPAGYAPPPCGATPMFGDVPVTSGFCRWIEELARRGVVGGCGNGNFCPSGPATREQMAVFVLRTLDPALAPPPCGAPMFADVPASSPFCKWIEELARRAVVTGCGGGNYCPAANVSREQMSVFLAVTFGIPLYGL
jgi:hypothetical protein